MSKEEMQTFLVEMFQPLEATVHFSPEVNISVWIENGRQYEYYMLDNKIGTGRQGFFDYEKNMENVMLKLNGNPITRKQLTEVLGYED